MHVHISIGGMVSKVSAALRFQYRKLPSQSKPLFEAYASTQAKVAKELPEAHVDRKQTPKRILRKAWICCGNFIRNKLIMPASAQDMARRIGRKHAMLSQECKKTLEISHD